LAGIFLYTAAAGVTNTVGRESVKMITAEYVDGMKNAKGIRVIDCGPETDDNAGSVCTEEPSAGNKPLVLSVRKGSAKSVYGKNHKMIAGALATMALIVIETNLKPPPEVGRIV
jgi:hypothetical protein